MADLFEVQRFIDILFHVSLNDGCISRGNFRKYYSEFEDDLIENKLINECGNNYCLSRNGYEIVKSYESFF